MFRHPFSLRFVWLTFLVEACALCGQQGVNVFRPAVFVHASTVLRRRTTRSRAPLNGLVPVQSYADKTVEVPAHYQVGRRPTL